MKRLFCLTITGLLATPLTFSQEIPIEMRPIYWAKGFQPQSYQTFCLEDLEEPNGLSDVTWSAVRQELIDGMQAKG